MNLSLGSAQKVQSTASTQKEAIKPNQASFPVPFFELHGVKEQKEEKKESLAGSDTLNLSSSREKPNSKSAVKKMPMIELTGIMMENPPQALINGRFLKVGGKFGGVKVVKIVSDSVTFEYQGRKFKKLLD
jgi:type II secretory pathway component PulC